MKTDQITIRISPELKQQLQESAKLHSMKTTEFIRQTLERVGDPKQIDVEARVEQLEKHILGYFWRNMEIIVIKALAMVVSMDKNMPIDQCLFLVSTKATEVFGTSPSVATQIPRSKREEMDLKFVHKVQSDLDLSPIAIMAISLIISTYLGMVYEEEIFQLTDFSMQTMQYLRDNLRSFDRMDV